MESASMPALRCARSSALFLFTVLFAASCATGGDDEHQERPADTTAAMPDQPATADTVAVANPPKDSAAAPTAANRPMGEPGPPSAAGHSYYFIHPKDSSGKAFLKSLSKEQLQIVYALNRVDPGPARRTDTLVIPAKWEADLMAYSPYPAEVPGLRDVKKIIFFSYPIQAFGVYENGVLKRWGPTSMGKKSTPTPTGLFFSNWKSKEAISTVDPTWKLKWNFNVSNKGGVGWHQYAMPGYPASHSCMRLYDYDARWLYDWADQWRLTADRATVAVKGTPCVIFGKYPFGQLKPWRYLPGAGGANDISADALMAEVQNYLPQILEAQRVRETAVAAAPPADSTL